MIIPNGTMQAYIQSSEGGYSIDGSPIAVQKVLGEPMEVNITGRRSKDTRTSNGNSYASAQYEVLCDDTAFNADEIQLTNSRGRNLGVFKVKDIQYLDYVDAVKIIAERYGE